MSEAAHLVTDELAAAPPDLARILVARGLVWSTTYREGGETRRGTVIAASRPDALVLVFQRGLSEVIDGRVMELTLREATLSHDPGGVRGGGVGRTL